MRKFLSISFILSILLSISFEGTAQYSGKQKKKKSNDKTEEYIETSENDFHKIWYGLDLRPRSGRLNLGGGFSGTQITLGFSPMVGYKFSKNFSMGPRLGLIYHGARINDGFGEDIVLDTWDYSIAGFARVNFWKYLFAHAEIEHIWESTPTGVIEDNNRLETETNSFNNYYLGGGFGTRGKKLSFAGYVLVDFTEEFNYQGILQLGVPFLLRIGVRYRY